VTKNIEIRIPDGTPRTRLEDFLFGYFPNLSRMYLRETVRDARCQVNGRHENVGFRVRAGDFVEIELDPARETAMRPQDIRLDIIFEDAHLLVVNKPAGMLVHPTHREKTGTLLNALAFYLNAECGVRSAESL
jgi:23S rRNA pseudouridine1911/1915/1917 synthase